MADIGGERLIERAKRVYLALRTVPLDLAAELMQRGFIVEELEQRWEKEVRYGQ